MSKERYQWYMGTSEIIDNKTKKFITQDCPELLNKQSKQISDLEAKLADLQQEQIAEMQEHQEAMQVADKTIKELEANLELHKQSNMVLNDQLNKATEHLGELEDKLAESDILLEKRISVYEKNFIEQTDENYKLKQQLAITDEQNKRVLEKLELIVSANQELEQKLAEKDEFLKKQKELFETVDRELYLIKDTLKHHTNIYNSLVESKDQDKISFCIEQLSTLRNFVNSKAIFSKNECECEVCKDISQTIANRIKRLEEGEWT